MRNLNWILFCLVLFFCTNSLAQTLLPKSAQTALSQLQSCGVVEKKFYSGRSLMAKDLKSILSQKKASQKYSCSSDQVEGLLSFLNEFLPQDSQSLVVNTIESAHFGADYLSGGDSRFPANNRGSILALANPFRENQQGRMIGEGLLLSAMTEHSLHWNDQSLYVAPRFVVNFSPNLDRFDQAQLTVDQAFVDLRFLGLKTQAGRHVIQWGQGQHGGFLFSKNSRALDHLLVSNQEPFRLPWIFSYLGKWDVNFIFGNFGPEQFYPWSYFTGLRVGLKPVDFLEFNLNHAMEFGGRNSPSVSASLGAREFFGFLPYVGQTGQGGTNKITSLDFRVYWDQMMGTQIYGSYMFDDANLSSGGLGKHMRHNSSYLVGVWFTRFVSQLNHQFRLEYTRGAPIAYRHGQFQQGWTSNFMILGDAIGPDGHEVDLNWDYQIHEKLSLTTNLIWQIRDSNAYNISPNGLSVGYTTNGTDEKRYVIRNVVTYQFDSFNLNLMASLQRVNNYNYILGQNQTEVASSVSVDLFF